MWSKSLRLEVDPWSEPGGMEWVEVRDCGERNKVSEVNEGTTEVLRK